MQDQTGSTHWVVSLTPYSNTILCSSQMSQHLPQYLLPIHLANLPPLLISPCQILLPFLIQILQYVPLPSCLTLLLSLSVIGFVLLPTPALSFALPLLSLSRWHYILLHIFSPSPSHSCVILNPNTPISTTILNPETSFLTSPVPAPPPPPLDSSNKKNLKFHSVFYISFLLYPSNICPLSPYGHPCRIPCFFYWQLWSNHSFSLPYPVYSPSLPSYLCPFQSILSWIAVQLLMCSTFNQLTPFLFTHFTITPFCSTVWPLVSCTFILGCSYQPSEQSNQFFCKLSLIASK